MSTHWGCDTADYSFNHQASVQRAYGLNPSFWGRYLPADAITPDEIVWMHNHSIAILALWNGEDANSVGLGYDYAHGQALAACAAWRTLGLPSGCAIVVDVEQPWAVSGQFLQGWLDGCHSQGYVGGTYLNVLSGVNHVAAWLWARDQTTAPGVVYSSEPELDAWRGTVKTDWYDFTQTPLGPRAGDVAFHQYSENELGATIDLDLATDAGYALCWGAVKPVPPKPSSYRVIEPGDLKTAPSHSSATAIDAHHRPVFLELGAIVNPIPPGTPVQTDDRWLAVRLPQSPVHGYFQVARLGPS